MAKSWPCFSFSFVPALVLSIVLASSASGRFVNEAKRNLLPTHRSTRDNALDNETGKSCTKSGCSFAVNASEAAKFRSLIYDENALAVFIFVTVGNTAKLRKQNSVFNFVNSGNYQKDEGKNMSSNELQIKQKWAWLRNKRGRFLATLPYDFDILSLTTLKRDAFSEDLNITTNPVNCYANLSQNCLYSLVARAIVEDLTGPLGNVCVRTEEIKEGDTMKDGGYLCCKQRNNSVFSCDIPIENNQWVEIALRFLWASSIGFGVFAPLLFKYLPKEFKRGPRLKTKAVFARHESEISEVETSSLADLTSVRTRQVLFALDGGMLDVLRTQTESVFFSRLCRCLFLILLSCLPILQGFIYAYLKRSEVGISTGKLLGVGDAFITLIERDGQFALSVTYCFCIVLICIAIAIPRTLSDFARRLSGRKDERTFLGFRKPDEIICSSDQRGFQLLYENMVFHLNCLLMFKFWKFAFLVITFPLQKVCGMDLFEDDADSGFHNEPSESEDRSQLCSKICRGVLLLLFFPLWAVTISTAFVLYVFPVTYVAFRVWKMLFRIEIESQCCQNIPSFVKITSFPVLYIMFIIFCMCVEASYFMLAVTLTINIMFLGSVAGFTIMGLLFYIDVYLPYIVLGAWVLMYTLRGVNKYYAQFTRLKTIVFEECEKFDNDTKTEASIRETFSGPISAERRSTSVPSLSRSKSVNFLVTVHDYGVPSIPLEIFLVSSQQLMPFKRIILAKLLKVIALGCYLVAIFLFVMSLMEFKAASSVVQGLALLLLGGLPLLAFQSQGHVSEAEEIRSRFYVKDFIKQYTKRAL